jgi:hypothetical protein
MLIFRPQFSAGKKSIASPSMHMKIKKHLIINNGEISKFK